MSTAIPFTYTQQSILVVIDGKTFTAQAGTLQYNQLAEAILKAQLGQGSWDDVRELTSTSGALRKWISGTEFTVGENGHTILYRGTAVPPSLQERIWRSANSGESPQPYLRFFERLALNPSYRSVQQLFNFMQHRHIPIEDDGHILTYKSVRPDLLDFHSATFDNSPGKVLKMPRNQISDDSDVACDEGFHVGALAYVDSFGTSSNDDYGKRILICRVDPMNVVSVPKDHSAQKIRVCEYTVVGFHSAPMPSTTVDTSYTKMDEDEDEDEGGVDEGRPTAVVDFSPLDADDEDEDDGDDDVDLDEDDDDLDDDDDDEDEDEDDDDADFSPAVPAPDDARVAAASRLANKRKNDRMRRLNTKTVGGLLEMSMDDLRAYASWLHIVGASKLPGGKVKLVDAIWKARSGKRNAKALKKAKAKK
jgi:hypothetical protein